MPAPCVLSLDNMTVVRKSFLTEPITRLSVEKLHAVCEALGAATAC